MSEKPQDHDHIDRALINVPRVWTEADLARLQRASTELDELVRPARAQQDEHGVRTYIFEPKAADHLDDLVWELKDLASQWPPLPRIAIPGQLSFDFGPAFE